MNKIKIVKNFSSLFFVQVANVLLPLLSIPYVVRIIGPEKFGLINYSGAIIGYFVMIVNYAFNLTASKSISQNNKDSKIINKVFNEVLGCQLLLWTLCFFVFLICIFFVPVFNQNNKVFIVTFLITIACVLTPDWIYQGMGDLHRQAFFNLISKLILTGLMFVLIKKPSDYFWQPLALSISQIFVSFTSLNYALLKYKLKIDLPKWSVLINVLNECKTIFFSSIIISLYTTTNIVVLGSLVSELEVGYFSAAQKLIILTLSLVLFPLTTSLFPFIGGKFSESIEIGINSVKKLVPIVATLMLIICLVLFFIGPWFLVQFYGLNFQKSINMFRIMAFIPFFISISNIYGIQIMLNLKLDKIILRITLFGALISLILNAYLGKWYGGIGSASSWLISELFISVIMAIYLFRNGIQIFSFKKFYPSELILSVRSLNKLMK
jgi:PST family polysaccharide transporter